MVIRLIYFKLFPDYLFALLPLAKSKDVTHGFGTLQEYFNFFENHICNYSANVIDISLKCVRQVCHSSFAIRNSSFVIHHSN